MTRLHTASLERATRHPVVSDRSSKFRTPFLLLGLFSRQKLDRFEFFPTARRRVCFDRIRRIPIKPLRFARRAMLQKEIR
jgi:hypothetical protein